MGFIQETDSNPSIKLGGNETYCEWIEERTNEVGDGLTKTKVHTI